MPLQTDWYEERGHAFGRGSPVRDYWLEHCDGFEAIGLNGRHLGRVSRFDSPEGTAFLRLSGRRSHVVPTSAVERVWPAASMLVIADLDLSKKKDGGTPNRNFTLRDEEAQNASQRSLAASPPRARWEDETVPWWELVPENGLIDEAVKPLQFASVPKLPRSAIRPHAYNAGRAVLELFGLIGEHARKLIAVVLRGSRKGWRVARSGMRVVGKRCLAAGVFGANLVERGRLRLGRLLIRLALWVAGDYGHLEDEIARRRRPDSAE
jgi:hypothetical protein